MKPQTKLVWLAALLCSLYVAAAQDSNDPTCPTGQVYNECGSPCPPTCDNRNPICATVCSPGCFCPRGMVLNDDRDCVSPTDCPVPTCPTGQVYNECGSPCPPTCDNRNPICTAVCSPGCFCEDGMVLNENQECVSTSDCPVSPCATVLCAQVSCGDGSEPITPVGECCPVCSACLDDSGQLLEPGTAIDSNSDPCTSCFCDRIGQLNCLSVLCAPVPEVCPDGSAPMRDESECCSRCPDPCELVDCALPECENGQEPFIPEGECCAQCPNDPCATVRCAGVSCADGSEPFTPPGSCCPVCRSCLDSEGNRLPEGEIVETRNPCSFCSCTVFGGHICAYIDCPFPDTCDDGSEPVVRAGECCASCDTEGTISPCATVLCAFIEVCPDGSEPITRDGECCPRCPTCTYNGTVYQSGATFTDGCNSCYCSSTGNIVCSDRACPNPCSLSPHSGVCLASFERYYYNTSTETCQRFTYGGCGGNDNNFETAHDCFDQCNPNSVCLRPVYPRDFEPVCDVVSRQWTFNSTRGRCMPIEYAECGQARDGFNVFSSERMCNNTCVNPGPRCPDGSEPVNCFVNPCEVSLCPAFPNATCKANFCGSRACSANYFDEDGNDVTSRCRGKCYSPIYPANFRPVCDALLPQWTYNATAGQCRRFEYAACGEDREDYNVFESESACEEACERQVQTCATDNGVEYNVGQVFPAGDGCNNCTCLSDGDIVCSLRPCINPCFLRPQVGDCDGAFPRYFYNQSAEMCQRFIYGGCGGNGNNFETARECYQQCDNSNVCNRPIYPPNFEPTCAAIEGQWTYNSTLGRCHEFGYFPCGEQREGYNVFDSERECNASCVRRPGEVPCDNMVYCFADPCSFASCPNFPRARCVSNYCGGCNALFFDPEGNDVTERCRADDSVCELPRDRGSDECDGDLPRLFYNSSVEVCQRFSYTGCGGNGNNFETGKACWGTCNPESICSQPIYPRGFRPTCRLLVERWTYNVTGAGCQEIEFSPCGQETEGYNIFPSREECVRTCVRPPLPSPTCPDGSEPVNCFVDPCETPCPAFPNARCEANFCGGCNAVYFDADGNDVTSRCRVILPTPNQVRVCPQVASGSIGTCSEQCFGCEELGQLCCPNGCGRSCMDPVLIPYYEIPGQCPINDGSLLDVCTVPPNSEICRSDEDCQGEDELCCRSGCNRVCRQSVQNTQPCFAITDLFNQTRSGSSSVLLGDSFAGFVGAYVPQCDAAGSFQPVQCHGSTGYCWCVHTQNGLPLSSPVRGKPECSSCTYNGETYYTGQQFPSMDGCNECFCSRDGAVACTERACPDICSLEVDPGPCRGAFPAYYYDEESGNCRQFTYGGCQGNDNKFKTVRDCLRRCDPNNICLSRPDPGPCEAFIPSIFFNATSGRCERFVYGGCQGNENNFETAAACQRACDSEDPIDPCLDEECPELDDCPDSRLVREPGECCAKCAPEECNDNQFLCSSGDCISSRFRCDGLTDCDDGDDEEDCPRRCDFMCGDGVCIPERYVCDGYLDCRDGSDARNCPTEFENTFVPQDIPRQCPNATGLIGACVVSCTSNDNCENGELCCSNGCGRTCVRGEPATPLCPALLRLTDSSLIGAFVPSCERDGSFSQVQCHGSTGFCWCVDTTTGQPQSDGVRGEPECGGCTDHNGDTFGYGDSFVAEDGCNICYCSANFGSLCTRRACSPEPCTVGDRTVEHGASFTDDCVSCQCLFGELNCTKRPCSLAAAIRRRMTQIRMAFNGNFDDLLPSDDSVEEIAREMRRTLLERYARLMGLEEKQVSDVKVERGSVIIIVVVNDTNSDTDGANVTLLVAQLEQDYMDGNFVIRFNGEVLEPMGQFQVEEISGEEEEVGFPVWAIAVIVVCAILLALAVLFFVVALIICCRKKVPRHSPLSDQADFGTANDYEVPMKQGGDISQDDSTDLKKTPL